MGAVGVSTNAWKKENTSQFNLRFTNASGIPAAVSQAAEKQGLAPVEYLKTIIREKLIADGYLSSEPEQKLKEE